MLIAKQICDQFSDVQLVKKSLEDIDYFSCLYEKYELKLLRYVKRIALVSNEEAEDILQEAFIKIWKNLNNFNQNLKLSSWIYRIVHNETISSWRKRKSLGKDRQLELDDSLFDSIPSDLEEEEDFGQKDLLTHEVLELLPLKYKSVLVLKYLEGMSYEDISDILKIPEGTVATYLNRAKKAFAGMAKERHISFAS